MGNLLGFLEKVWSDSWSWQMRELRSKMLRRRTGARRASHLRQRLFPRRQQKRPDLGPGVLCNENQTEMGMSARVELDDELLVDDRVDVGTFGDAGDGGFEFVLVHAEPIDGVHGLGEVGHAQDQLLG